MKKIVFIFMCLILATGICFGKPVRRKMADGRFKFVDLAGETHYDSNGNVTYDKDLSGNEFFYTYDDKGNKLTCKHGVNGITDSWEYDAKGRVIREEIGYNSPICYEYDNKGNLVKKYEDSNYSPKVAIYEYDENNKLIYLDDGFSGEQFIYEYDNKGNLIHSFDTNNNEKFYDNDDKGNVIAIVNGNDELLESFKYNEDGKLIKRIVPAKGWYGTDYIEEYDALGNLLKLQEEGYTYIYEYSARGLVTKLIKKYYSDEYDYDFDYEYDAKGNPTKRYIYLTYSGAAKYK